MAKYGYTAGFWLSLLFAAWALYGLGHGFEMLANDPHKYANDVMIPSLVLLSGLAAFFVWCAVHVRRRARRSREALSQ